MTATTLAAASVVQKWDTQFFDEYVRNSGFRAYMGRGSNMPIVTKYQLASGGQTINIPLVTRLTGSGVSGNTALEGNEEALGNYSHAISIGWKRNGVLITKDQEHWSAYNLRQAAKDQLSNWAMSGLRSDIIAQLQTKGGVLYGAATEAQKDAWVDNNIDRVLFGDAPGNVSTSAPAGGATHDHSASLLAITSAMTLGKAEVSLMKRLAKTADPHIRPMRVNDSSGREYFVMFAGSLAFRDLKADLDTSNLAGRERNVDSNPVFQDGDLVYDGVIIREIPEMPVLSGVGATSGDVSPVFLCGAQALGVAWGQEPKSKVERRDYDFYYGVGIEEARGVSKLVYNNVDHGLVTGYFATTAD